jgi:hypothetical protein
MHRPGRPRSPGNTPLLRSPVTRAQPPPRCPPPAPPPAPPGRAGTKHRNRSIRSCCRCSRSNNSSVLGRRPPAHLRSPRPRSKRALQLSASLSALGYPFSFRLAVQLLAMALVPEPATRSRATETACTRNSRNIIWHSPYATSTPSASDAITAAITINETITVLLLGPEQTCASRIVPPPQTQSGHAIYSPGAIPTPFLPIPRFPCE